jgi:hypothetical protein
VLDPFPSLVKELSVINFDNPTLVPDPFEDGKTCPSCGSFHVMFQRRRGGRCTDAFHDIATIAAMEAQFLSPDDLWGPPDLQQGR